MRELISKLTGIKNETLVNISISDMFKRVDALDITKAQKEKLKALGKFVSEYNETEFVAEKTVITSSGKAQEVVRAMFKSINDIERFRIIWLNSQNQIIEVYEHSIGTVNESAVHPREIVKSGILNNATSCILCHNHPGGSLFPSDADKVATSRIATALKTVNINVIDHVIASEYGCYSFAEQGIL